MAPSIILGGGLSGLSAAYYLLQRVPNPAPQLIEVTHRLGGWIKSTTQHDGVVFEQGPRTVRPKGAPGANTLSLIEELSLTDKLMPIIAGHPAATNRMIFAHDELHVLPTSIKSLFTHRKPFSKPLIRLLLKDIFTPSQIALRNDESIYDFVCRRFGSEVGDYLIAPMICGICAGDAKQISVKLLMESLFEKEQTHGSITKGVISSWFAPKSPQSSSVAESKLQQRATREKWNVYSFQGGIEVLPRRLEEVCRANGATFHLGVKCVSLDFQPDGIHLELSTGEKMQAKHLISSIPAKELSVLIAKQHPELSERLHRIETVSLAVVNLQYNENLHIDDAFGFLVCPRENRPLLGVIYDSCCFPYSDKTVLTVMLGGHWFHKYFSHSTSDKEFLHIAQQQIGDILKIHQRPDNFKVHLLRNAIPQYTVGHKENLQRIEAYIKTHNLPLGLCGCSYHGIGVNDVILSAKNVVNDLYTST